MPCSSALVKKVKTISPDDIIEDVIGLFHKHGLENVPVLDEKKKLLGVFSLHFLMRNLLPVSMNVPSAGMAGSVKISAAPGVAKRLRKLKPLRVRDLMKNDFTTVRPETPLWEGIALMTEHKEPVFIVEPETGKFLGVMDMFTALAELERLQKEEENA